MLSVRAVTHEAPCPSLVPQPAGRDKVAHRIGFVMCQRVPPAVLNRPRLVRFLFNCTIEVKDNRGIQRCHQLKRALLLRRYAMMIPEVRNQS